MLLILVLSYSIDWLFNKEKSMASFNPTTEFDYIDTDDDAVSVARHLGARTYQPVSRTPHNIEIKPGRFTTLAPNVGLLGCLATVQTRQLTNE